MEADHYVPQPRFLFFLRIAQMVLALVALALTAFSMAKLNSIWISGSFGYAIFCCIYTLLTGTYLLVSEAHFLNMWNRWVALAIDVVGVLFWISAWGSLAAWAAVNDFATSALNIRDALPVPMPKSTGYDDPNYPFDSAGWTSFDTRRDTAGNQAAWKCAAAAAGLGGLIWVLYVIALITYSIALHRFRRARSQGAGAAVQVVQEPKGQHEMGNMAPTYPQQQPVYPQQQPVYPQQQPVYPQQQPAV